MSRMGLVFYNKKMHSSICFCHYKEISPYVSAIIKRIIKVPRNACPEIGDQSSVGMETNAHRHRLICVPLICFILYHFLNCVFFHEYVYPISVL